MEKKSIHRKVNPDIIKDINRVAIDSRLPYGFKSWLQLAKKVQNQDELNLRNDNILVRVFRNGFQTMPVECYKESSNEVFECDVLSLKIRAFDEIKDLIPDFRELQDMRHEQLMLKHQGHFNPMEKTRAEKLIDKLLLLID